MSGTTVIELHNVNSHNLRYSHHILVATAGDVHENILALPNARRDLHRLI